MILYCKFFRGSKRALWGTWGQISYLPEFQQAVWSVPRH